MEDQPISNPLGSENVVQLPVPLTMKDDSYVVLRNHNMQVGETFVELRQGQIVSGERRIRMLLDHHAPIVPTAGSPDYAACPHCGTVFSLKGRGGPAAA